MRTKTFMAGLAILIIGGIFFIACQKEESIEGVRENVATEMTEPVRLKSGSVLTDCTTNCIDPEAPEYFVVYDQLVVGWAGPDNNKFSKTIEIKYYNTLTHFELKVMSSNGIADVLMDNESIINFQGTVPPDTWQEFSFELEEEWRACDTWEFELKVTGFGPTAYFDVEYHLIGECVYYTLDLAVYPEDAGTVTGAGEYKKGEEVDLTATANEGYVFINWTDEDGDEISYVADFIYTMPAYDITLTANFEEEDAGWPRDTETEVVEVTNPNTGRVWMDRNLGASRAATSSTDPDSYGDLYQWGRAADGHQVRKSGTTSTLSSSDTPGHGNFILSPNLPCDWRSPQNDNLWQGLNGTNNPCPAGYRLPTAAELVAERQSWTSDNAAGAFASPLKLPVAGWRIMNGWLTYVGEEGFYWASTVYGDKSWKLSFDGTGAPVLSHFRALGFSVRCIKD